MRTRTFARLSLLIPFLVWGIFLLYAIFSSTLPAGGPVSTMSNPIVDWFIRSIYFYLIGIIFWIVPYILLGSILFSLTFIWQPPAVIKVFALSPIAMVILTLAVTNILAFWDSGEGTYAANPYSNLQDLTSFNILVATFVLIWSYVCVGFGLGVYKLLRRFKIINDEVGPVAEPRLAEILERAGS